MNETNKKKIEDVLVKWFGVDKKIRYGVYSGIALLLILLVCFSCGGSRIETIELESLKNSTAAHECPTKCPGGSVGFYKVSKGGTLYFKWDNEDTVYFIESESAQDGITYKWTTSEYYISHYTTAETGVIDSNGDGYADSTIYEVNGSEKKAIALIRCKVK
ncbi:MAG: hypothetical protein IJ666_01790 [Ruminococcus sp.]|nr:hypothetical protein [Ruminococcus sp.]